MPVSATYRKLPSIATTVGPFILLAVVPPVAVVKSDWPRTYKAWSRLVIGLFVLASYTSTLLLPVSATYAKPLLPSNAVWEKPFKCRLLTPVPIELEVKLFWPKGFPAGVVITEEIGMSKETSSI